MKFLWTAIYAKNLNESVAFYSDMVGLKVLKRFQAGPTTEIAMMGNGAEGEPLVELLAESGRADLNHDESIVIGFQVESIGAMLDNIKEKRIPVHAGPVETPRSKFFYVLDPNGVRVQFLEQKS